MINFRSIFNPSYNYIGLVFIVIIALLIIIIQKDTLQSLLQITKISLIAGIITLLLTVIINFSLELLVPNTYQIFLRVITKNVISSLYFYTVLIIVLSAIINSIIRIFTRKKYSI